MSGVYRLNRTNNVVGRISQYRAVGGFLPTDLAGLKLWLDFSDSATLFTDAGSTPVVNDDDLIYQANDKSGEENHVIQATEANRPLYKTGVQNGLSAGLFDGLNDSMFCDRLYTAADFSIFIVAKGAAQQNKGILAQHPNLSKVGRTVFILSSNVSPYSKMYMFFNNGSSYAVPSTTVAFDNTAKLLYSYSDGSGTSHVRVNGGSAEGTLNEQNWTPYDTVFQVGCYGTAISRTGFYTGHIAEIVCYSHLSDANRVSVETYLNNKWAIY